MLLPSGEDEAVVEAAAWPQRLTPEEADLGFMLFLDDDTEDAPLMVMGDLQFSSASSFVALPMHEREGAIATVAATVATEGAACAGLTR